MEKTIQLKNDQVFRRAVRINLNRNHTVSVNQRAEGVREAICDLVIRGKLDAIDLKIIEARDCSPMPSMRDVAGNLKIDVATVSRKLQRIRCLITTAYPA